jgi:uncharacterized membrane-anchored protein YjiN (DUF445 family)
MGVARPGQKLGLSSRDPRDRRSEHAATPGCRLASLYEIETSDFRSLRRHQRLRTLDLAPPLGRAIEVLTSSQESDIIFDKLVDAAKNYIMAKRAQIDEMVNQRSHWWIPRTINRRIAAAIVNGTIDLLHRLRRRDSEARVQLRATVASLAN